MHQKNRAYEIYLAIDGAQAFLFAAIFTASGLYQVTVVGLSPLQLVLVGTLLESVYFLFEVPTGVIADTFGRRASVIVSMFTVGTAFIVEGGWPAFGAVLAAQVLFGIGATFSSGAFEAWLTDEVGAARAEQAFLRSSQISAITGLAGIAAATTLASVAGLGATLVAGGAGIAGLGMVLLARMPETGFVRHASSHGNPFGVMARTLREGIRVIRASRLLVILTAVSLINGLYSEAFDRLWTAHLVQDFALPALGSLALGAVQWFGLVRMAAAVLAVAAAEFVRRRLVLTDPRGTSRALFITTCGAMAGMVVFALAGDVWLAVSGYLLAAAVRGPLATVRLSWVNRQIGDGDSHVRATVLSLWSQADAMGQVTGGPVLGALGEVSLRLALAASAAVLALKLPLYAAAARLAPRGRTSTPRT